MASDERRKKSRIDQCRVVRVVFDGYATMARLHDISETGALLSRIPGATSGALCVVQVPGHGSAAATIARATVGKTAVTFPPDAILREQYGDPVKLYRSILGLDEDAD